MAAGRVEPLELDGARLVYADGAERGEPLSPDQQVALYARCLHEGRPGLVEVVAGRRRADGSLGMRRRGDPGRFPAAGDLRALVRLARQHRAAGEEVFCTPLTRRVARPGRQGEVLAGTVVWVDVDEPAELWRLRAFRHRPHLVVYSGSGGAHAYWRLATTAAPAALEAANRKLAAHLGGDLGCCDNTRIMRLPGSHNGKAGRPCRLAFVDLARPGVALAELVRGLADPEPPPRPADPRKLRRRLERSAVDHARRLPPPAYFRLLAGVDVPERGGDVRCPLPDHDEQNPSCRVYPSPERGWVCFGCRRGGSIYDLASLLERGPGGRRGALHGEEFRRVRQRVRELLGLAD